MGKKSTSILYYEYVKPTWDAVYEMSVREPDCDITIDQTFKTTGERVKFSLAMHKYRVGLQEINARLYPRGHPSHGTTIFDHFIISNAEQDGRLVLKVRKREAKGVKVSAGDSVINVDNSTSEGQLEGLTSNQGEE